jgi:hypothetical protein
VRDLRAGKVREMSDRGRGTCHWCGWVTDQAVVIENVKHPQLRDPEGPSVQNVAMCPSCVKSWDSAEPGWRDP